MKVVAVVVTYNSADRIGVCLDALDGAGVPVVVVDNASSDATAGIVEACHPTVTLIRNTCNVGFSAAVNVGCANTASDFVALVNPDCVVEPDTIHRLLDRFDASPVVAIAGPRLRGADGRVAVSAHRFETVWTVIASRFGGSLLPLTLRRWLGGGPRRCTSSAAAASPATEVDWVSGACLVVRRQLLDATGGMDERYFLYYEDEELCWQASERGQRVIYDANATAMHIGGASDATAATWPHLYRSMLLFFARHRAPQYQAVRAAVLVRSGVGIAVAGIRFLAGDSTAGQRYRAWCLVAAVSRQTSKATVMGAG